MVSSYLTFSPLPVAGKPSTGGLFSVALSLPHDKPPLTATLPHGVRTFLAPVLSGAATVQSPPAILDVSCIGRLQLNIHDPSTIRVWTIKNFTLTLHLAALNLIAHVRWYSHVAALACFIFNFNHC